MLPYCFLLVLRHLSLNQQIKRTNIYHNVTSNVYLNLVLLCSANLASVKWYLKVDLICTFCISGGDQYVSLYFFAIYKFPRVTRSLGLGQGFFVSFFNAKTIDN